MISIKLTQFFSLLLLSLSHDFLNIQNPNDKALYPRPSPIVPSIRYYEYPIRPRKIKKFRFPMEPKLKSDEEEEEINNNVNTIFI